jgi:hypothetical protein
VPCWSSSVADREITSTSGVGCTRVASQVSGAASAPASDISSGTSIGTFLCLVSQMKTEVTP